jgi:hypothetical protein
MESEKQKKAKMVGCLILTSSRIFKEAPLEAS